MKPSKGYCALLRTSEVQTYLRGEAKSMLSPVCPGWVESRASAGDQVERCTPAILALFLNPVYQWERYLLAQNGE